MSLELETIVKRESAYVGRELCLINGPPKLSALDRVIEVAIANVTTKTLMSRSVAVLSRAIGNPNSAIAIGRGDGKPKSNPFCRYFGD